MPKKQLARKSSASDNASSEKPSKRSKRLRTLSQKAAAAAAAAAASTAEDHHATSSSTDSEDDSEATHKFAVAISRSSKSLPSINVLVTVKASELTTITVVQFVERVSNELVDEDSDDVSDAVTQLERRTLTAKAGRSTVNIFKDTQLRQYLALGKNGNPLHSFSIAEKKVVPVHGVTNSSAQLASESVAPDDVTSPKPRLTAKQVCRDHVSTVVTAAAEACTGYWLNCHFCDSLTQEALLNPVGTPSVSAAATAVQSDNQVPVADIAPHSADSKAPSDKAAHIFTANLAHVKLKQDVYGLDDRQLYIWAEKLTRSEWVNYDVPPPGIGNVFGCGVVLNRS